MINKDIIEQSQRCQRNWDLTKSVKDEDIELFKTAVSQCPSKQNRIWYNVVFVKDRKIIEKIHDTTDRFDYPDGIEKTNSQTLANLLVIFNADKDERVKTTRDELLEDFDESYFVGSSIGIASGYLNLTAHLLGYKTGFCGGFRFEKVDKILNTKNSKLIMGIGYPDDKRDRREHHLDFNYIYPSYNKDIKIKVIE
tara:strand:- start:2715 stop:3302 length:588 start_codon:yes stop_codon:yes gene_type:complete